MSMDSISSALGSRSDAASLRPTLAGRTHMVSTGHPLATEAAYAILQIGGNATDAGVAAGICLGVVHSEMVNFAGVAPILVFDAASGRTHSVSGVGTWPARADVEVFRRDHGGAIPEGVLRTVVPAAPDAWISALRRFGTMSFATVAERAIEHAREGFFLTRFTAEMIELYASQYARWPTNAAVYLPGGEVPAPYSLFRQRDLAYTLELMVGAERSASPGGRDAGLQAARDAFYRGEIAERIVAFQRGQGGWLDRADMENFSVDVEDSISVQYVDIAVHACNAWCQGPTLLQMLNMVEASGATALSHNSAEYLHRLAEIIKLAFADRHAYLGDPRFVDVPLDALLSMDYAKRRVSEIFPDAAIEGLPAGGLGGAAPPPAGRRPRSTSLDTSCVTVVDRQGNAFTATPSDVSFDTPVVPGLGICPSTRGSQSWTGVGHPSVVGAGRRPRLTPSPAMIVGPGGRVMPLATPGGDVQLQALLQVLINLVDFGMEHQAAVEAPRIASYAFEDSFEPHRAQPGILNAEARLPGPVLSALADLGHNVGAWPEWTWRAGAVCLVDALMESQILFGAADPRRASYALGI